MKRYLYDFETNEDPAGADPAGGTPAPEAIPPAADEWRGPTKEEWQTVVGGLQYLAQQANAGGQSQPDPEPDFSEADLEDMDAGELLQHYVDSRLSEIEPYVANAAKESGTRRMNELFD